ncbi:endonuclease domain-containing protein [Vibrio litoralis]|uniref:endonuclease domain-containing protein n=1 Tax=Vibrio litoralis TaxID=335972 RepID=UPI001FD2B325|nr:endonuclease domain-containing protein [Vibrio litoralis]
MRLSVRDALALTAKKGGKRKRDTVTSKAKPSRSALEVEMINHIRALKLPMPVEEFRFHPERKWRFDFAYPNHKVAIEVEGGTWSGGRHTRGSGYEKDCEKYNAASLLGWSVYRFTSTMIKRGEAINTIEKSLKEVGHV